MKSKLIALISLVGLLLIGLTGLLPVAQAASGCIAASVSGSDIPPFNISVSAGQTLTITFNAPGASQADWEGTFVGQPFSGFGITSLTFTGTAPSDGVFILNSLSTIGGSQAAWNWNYSITEACLFNDGRINPEPQASMVGYCTDNRGIETYLPNGRKLFTVTAGQIKSALTRAISGKRHVLIKQDAGQQLWALKSNELQFHNALGQKYDFIFPPDRC